MNNFWIRKTLHEWKIKMQQAKLYFNFKWTKISNDIEFIYSFLETNICFKIISKYFQSQLHLY